MCCIVVHNKSQPEYEDEESSIGDRIIPKNVTTEALGALGATFNFIDFCLKLSKRIMTQDLDPIVTL